MPTRALKLPKSVDATTAKNNLGELLDKAHFGEVPFLVTKRREPWAIILGIDVYEDLLDQLDTMTEQIDPRFQKSLHQSMKECRRGNVCTVGDIQEILRSKGKRRA